MKYFYSWLAGFFEGEGCFHLNTKQARAFITITQANDPNKPVKETFEQIKSIYNGSIFLRKEYTPNRKPMYIWTITKPSDIEKFFHNILPYMKLRKKEMQNKLTKYKQLKEKRKLYIPDLHKLTYKAIKQKYGICYKTIRRMKKNNLLYCRNFHIK